MRGKKGQLIAGLVLITLGGLFILDRLIILEIYISWPVILVAVGVALFLINRHSLASWIVGGIGVILFIVNFVIAFFPEVEAWSDLVWPTILVIIGVLLLYRYYQAPSPKPPARLQPPKQEDRGAKPDEPPKSAES
jgi:membrane-bound ClpP family serine protease